MISKQYLNRPWAKTLFNRQKTQCFVLGRSFVQCTEYARLPTTNSSQKVCPLGKKRNDSYCAETSFTERETLCFVTRQELHPLGGKYNVLILGRNYVNWGNTIFFYWTGNAMCCYWAKNLSPRRKTTMFLGRYFFILVELNVSYSRPKHRRIF